MATLDECRRALHDLAARLESNAEARGKLDLERTLACRLTDLGAAFNGRITGGRLVDITDGDNPKAKIALVTTSDELLDLVDGKLELSRMVTAIRANPFDLLKLRKLL